MRGGLVVGLSVITRSQAEGASYEPRSTKVQLCYMVLQGFLRTAKGRFCHFSVHGRPTGGCGVARTTARAFIEQSAMAETE